MRKNTAIGFLVTLVASIGLDIVLITALGHLPPWLMPAKLAFLAALLASSLFVKTLRGFRRLLILLITILASQWLFDFLKPTPLWTASFPANTFAGNLGGTILLKLVTVIPVVLVLYLLAGSWATAYLTRGDLGAKAEKIPWLGIQGNQISWAKLSIVSAFLIALGTVLLTVLTATGGAIKQNPTRLLGQLPLILLLAAVNSACEGIVFRSAILASLRDTLPKGSILLIAAAFFGLAHYYGVPSGILGAAMSGVLGWYLCRSMYETGGFLSSWIIHFLQDVVIFSTLYLFGRWA